MEKIKYKVNVQQCKKGHEDYPIHSGFDVEAINAAEAKKQARQSFSEMTGYDLVDTRAYVIDQHITEYNHSLTTNNNSNGE